MKAKETEYKLAGYEGTFVSDAYDVGDVLTQYLESSSPYIDYTVFTDYEVDRYNTGNYI